MKLDSHIDTADPVAEVAKKEVEKKQQHIGSLKIYKGHTLYEINLKERTIEEAQFEEVKVDFEKEAGIKKKQTGLGIQRLTDGKKRLVLIGEDHKRLRVVRKENCIYLPALNRKNLRKKLVKKGIIKIVKVPQPAPNHEKGGS